MSDMIDGNMIALSRYEEEQAKQEAEQEERDSIIRWMIDLVEEVQITLDDYDPNNVPDLIERMDKAAEQLSDLIGKLEGER
jgi:hypothetical protein